MPEIEKNRAVTEDQSSDKSDADLAKEISANFTSGDTNNGFDLAEKNFAGKSIDSPELSAAFIQSATELLRQGDYGGAVKIFKNFHIPGYQTREETLGVGGQRGLNMIVDTLPQSFIDLPEAQQAAREGILHMLSQGRDGLWSQEQDFGIDQEFFSSELSQQAAEQGIIKTMSRIVPSDETSLPDRQMSIKKDNERLIRKAKSLAEKVRLAPDQWDSTIDKAVFAPLETYSGIGGAAVVEIHKLLDLPNDLFNKPGAQEKISAALIGKMAMGDKYAVRGIIDNLPVGRETLDNPGLEKAAKEYVMIRLKRGDVAADAEMPFFSLSGDFLKGPEAQAAAVGGFLRLIKEGNADSAMEFQKKFLDMPANEVHQLVLSTLGPVFEGIQKISPQIVDKAKVSPELAYFLGAYAEKPEKLESILRTNTFLVDAIDANDRFGPRLATKWEKLGQNARNKISELFTDKKTISIMHPDLPPEGAEFRKEMQDRLMKFGRNNEIVGQLADSGVDTDQWLNYQEVRRFVLQPEQVSFLEQAGPAADRQKTAVKEFGERTINLLEKGNYRQTASEIKVRVGSAEEESKIVENIAKIENKLTEEAALLHERQQTGEPMEVDKIRKRIEGMNAALEKHRGKLARLKEKKSTLWEAVTSGIADYSKSEQKLSLCQETLKQAEEEYTRALREPSVDAQKVEGLKAQINTSKEEFKQALGQMERRFEEFRKNLPQWLDHLPQGEGQKIIDSLNRDSGMLLTHYQIDTDTLSEVISRGSENQAGELSNRPMSVKVWSRNPDMDLYQGNYCPCCVSIEGGIHGQSSPIADYNTDLGIQVVNIYDEAKKIPVVAAWCWIGKDKNGHTAMVVDNIEANTGYSNNAPDALADELFGYLTDYARASNVDALVLGVQNNDLPKEERFKALPKTAHRYRKLGGTNDENYYLEAEEDRVVSLWAKEQGANI